MAGFEYNKGNLHFTIKKYPDSPISIVFIHGFALDKREWTYQTAFCDNNKTSYVSYDMRGFGESSLPVAEYSHIEDLDALTEYLQVNKVIICGHSFGGKIALNFALKYPQKVVGLVLIAPSSVSSENEDSGYFSELKHMAESSDSNSVKQKIINHSSFQQIKHNAVIFELAGEMVNGYSLWHFLHKDLASDTIHNIDKINQITCPTKIVIGSLDSKSNIQAAREIASQIRNSEFIVVNNSGHFLNLEYPDVLNLHVQNLINEVTSKEEKLT